ncbi:hypothetical protein BDZ97DRAFT_781639 [Flammula alnicola]|nr:hypothetical protein BDZ97DRAFT_781639 [Flammula alnicola]
MTIAALRSLHAIIGDAIDDIERIYASHGDSSNSEPSSERQTPENLSSSSDHFSGENATPVHRRKSSQSNLHAYVSPPPSPLVATSSYDIPPPPGTLPPSGSSTTSSLDFPSLDAPWDPTSLSEALTKHPVVLSAIGRIVAAAGQMTATAQIPFLSLCDASMGYHVPSCMRLMEASHVVEILREAGPGGLDVQAISKKNGVAANKLAHILRLLATHHLLREVSPDVFALNRLSSLVDSGKTFAELKQFEADGRPEMKYRDTNGIAAFVGLCSDELQKSAAYMTETYYLSPSQKTREGTEPGRAPFCFAFDTVKTGTGFFEWLEGEAKASSNDEFNLNDESTETGRGGVFPPMLEPSQDKHWQDRSMSERPGHHSSQRQKRVSPTSTDSESSSTVKDQYIGNSNRFRLERFGKAMSGTDGWETPGAVLNAFDWHSLPRGSIIVDVGGGIGSTSMLLATAFSSSDEDALRLKFIIQDRPVVCEMGEKAWKAKCPELLNSTAEFQVHDFFTPQPVRNAAVFLLRVVLHDWPDDFARKILLHLREAATPDTKLLIAEFVLPLACPDDTGSNGGLEDVEGAASILPPAPLLPNLGKASSNVYLMDLTMQVVFNAQERTLREMVALTLSAGWKVVKVTKSPGSLFGHMVAVPVTVPEQYRAMKPGSLDDHGSKMSVEPNREGEVTYNLPRTVEKERKRRREMDIIERASSRCGTPTFGSNTRLSSMEEALSRFGAGIGRSKTMARNFSSPSGSAPKPPLALKPALSLSSTVKKKKPSPLSVPPLHSSPTPLQSPRRLPSASPRHENSKFKAQSPVPPPRIITRRMSLANLRPHSQHGTIGPPPPLPVMRQPPPSPLSPRNPHPPLSRRASHAQLSQISASHSQSPVPSVSSFIPVRSRAEPISPNGLSRPSASIGAPTTASRHPAPATVISRRASVAQLPQVPLRKRSGTVATGGLVTSASEGRISGLMDAGAVLRFDVERKGDASRASTSMRPLTPVLGGVGILAAAARIDRGDFSPQPRSP